MEAEFEEKIKSYSLNDLYDIRENIDKEKYPERLSLVVDRIEKLEKLGDSLRVDDESLNAKQENNSGFSLKDGAGVFDRVDVEPSEKIIPDSLYNAILGIVLTYGFLVNYFMVKYIDQASIQNIGPPLFLIGYFVSCFFGIYLFVKSQKPIVSFIGYNFVVVPFGLVLNVFVSRYDSSSVLDAVFITGAVTISMMCLGITFPKLFQKMEKILLIALVCVVIFEWFGNYVKILDSKPYNIGVALIFCGYIAVDWVRANRIPKTIDNAVDSAAALYMDIINLFLRLLKAMGKKRR